ncbi:MAG: hypothetical protein V4690_01685 [Patescibacteria group bacterium]
MKVIIFGDEKEKIEKTVVECGFEIVETEPDFIVTFGGDGTIVRAEAAYPGIPKIVLKNSLVCKKCSKYSNEEVLKKVKAGEYRKEEMFKIEATLGNKTLYAMGEIILHNEDPRHAVRYTVSVNDEQIGDTIIGDGIVVATPFGSTGYYRSITDSYFELGIGLAFNNSTEQSDHVVIKEDSVIKLSLSRGPAMIYADNQKESIELKEGEHIEIKKSNQKVTLVKV